MMMMMIIIINNNYYYYHYYYCYCYYCCCYHDINHNIDDDTIHQLKQRSGPHVFFQGGFCQSLILAVWRHTDLHEVAILASRFGFPAVEVEKVRTSLTKSPIFEKAT